MDLDRHQTSIAPWKFRAQVAALGVVLTLLLVRLVDLQIIQGKKMWERAEDNRLFLEYLPRNRGVILDRFGDSLAHNQPQFISHKLDASLFDLGEPVSGADALARIATGSSEIVVQPVRHYPFGAALAHTVGYVGAVSSDDLITDSDLRPTDIIGKSGLELFYDFQLRGRPGTKQYEVDALGQRRAVISELASEPGATLQTTLDPYLSSVAESLLGDKRGSVIITDAKTGAILTLISSPSYDPNILTETELDPDKERERKKAVQALVTHPQRLFFDRAISGMYPPGSIFKLVTAMAGLESGAFDENTTVQDDGVLTVNDYSYANWYFTQYGRTEGPIQLVRAISRSNDIYFYKAAEMIGPNKLADFSRVFGFGRPTGIELYGEARGLIADPIWKEQVLGERWFLGNTYHFGIGQGLTLVTPIQIAQLLQSIANKGTYCQPTLLLQNSSCQGLGLAEEHLELVLRGMLDVCSLGGTAYPFFPHNTAFRTGEGSAQQQLKAGAVACKTGTAEFGSTDEKGYKQTHAWFAAAVGTKSLLSDVSEEAVSDQIERLATEETPYSEWHKLWKEQVATHDFPEVITITVLVESDEIEPYREGSRDAAPIAAAIIDWMQGKMPKSSLVVGSAQ
ncbi:MAG: hypothetical protein COY80_01660 [Candidatus Pacebacteria bacterium CG_4_10_14_0_8_um_filter_42_14]|nr:MAG: hypothetical protein COY80_01660 [Candidatus Pacebacteria bacterium CG_4_10_14_0_8_um_filter_42_14]